MLNCYLLTGSLTFEFCKWKDLFDFSQYAKDSKVFNETNKKNIGKMKDEFCGAVVTEFVG